MIFKLKPLDFKKVYTEEIYKAQNNFGYYEIRYNTENETYNKWESLFYKNGEIIGHITDSKEEISTYKEAEKWCQEHNKDDKLLEFKLIEHYIEYSKIYDKEIFNNDYWIKYYNGNWQSFCHDGEIEIDSIPADYEDAKQACQNHIENHILECDLFEIIEE